MSRKMMGKAMRRKKTHQKKKTTITTIAINTTIFTIKTKRKVNQ
jgi:hypothetical protein